MKKTYCPKFIIKFWDVTHSVTVRCYHQIKNQDITLKVANAPCSKQLWIGYAFKIHCAH